MRLRGVWRGPVQQARLQPQRSQRPHLCALQPRNLGFALRQLLRERCNLRTRGSELLTHLLKLFPQRAAVRVLPRDVRLRATRGRG